MRVKDSSVNIVDIENYLKSKHDTLDTLWKKYGADELVITSGRDGKHGKGSLHNVGRAEDYRLWNLPNMNIQRFGLFLKELEDILPDAPFDVIIEWDPLHIHAEYDPHPVKEKIALRLQTKIELQEYAISELGKIDTDISLLHSIITSDVFKTGEKIVKITANIIGEHYAGIKVFEVKEEKDSILVIIRKILKSILDVLQGGK